MNNDTYLNICNELIKYLDDKIPEVDDCRRKEIAGYLTSVLIINIYDTIENMNKYFPRKVDRRELLKRNQALNQERKENEDA